MPNTHGGSRPGAGRKPRTDGRKSRVLKVWLTEVEFANVCQMNTDERRIALLYVVHELMIRQMLYPRKCRDELFAELEPTGHEAHSADDGEE